MYIDTPEDFRAIREKLEPVYLNSPKHGQVAVPCMNTLLVRRELVVANTYNPNRVSDDKMELLRQSIVDNGWCFPIVAIWDDESEHFVIIDGFHRGLQASAEWLDLDYVPLVCLPHSMADRMSATVQFNKARGVHQVDLDAEIIRSLIEQGLDEEEISTRLGIDLDTIHRYKQLTGVAELFANADYSLAWEMVEEDDEVAV